MRAERRLLELGPEWLVEVKYLLKGAGLPHEDVAEPGRRFYRLEDGAGPLGWGGLEIYGADALLRSLVILEHRRRLGTGTDLVERLAAEARALGVERLWLLTTTAAPFFTKLGFDLAKREAAPEAIRSTREFAGICPASAAFMMRRLRDTE